MDTTKFRYKGFTPDDYILAESQNTIESIEDIVPLDSTIIAVLEYDREKYTCMLDVYLKKGSVYASTTDRNPVKAMARAEEVITNKLRHQKETKFFTRNSDLLTNKKENTFGTMN